MNKTKRRKINLFVITIVMLLVMTTLTGSVFAVEDSGYETSCDKYTDVGDTVSDTQYSYRVLYKQISPKTSITGWTRGSEADPTYGAWTNVGWTNTKPTASDVIKIIDKKTETQYRYKTYANGTNYHFCPVQGNDANGITYTLKYSGWSTTRYSGTTHSQQHYNVGGATTSKACSTCGLKQGEKPKKYLINSVYYYYEYSRNVEVSWYYQKRTKTTNYNYSKYSDWSDWSFDEVTSIDELGLQLESGVTATLETKSRDIVVDKYGIYYSPDLTEIYYVPSELTVNEFYVPDSVTKIHDNAFKNCTGISYIVLPKNLKTIGTSAFEGCSAIGTITIPESVTSIGANAFKDCSSLELVFFKHEAPISIGSNCFSGTAMTDIYVYFLEFKDSWLAYKNSWNGFPLKGYNPAGETYSNIDDTNTDKRGLTYSFDTATNTAKVIGFSGSGKVTVPKRVVKESVSYEVTSFDSSAFSGNTGLTEITFTKNITAIPTNAFKGCSALEKVVMATSISNMGASAFENCSKLERFDYLGKLTTIPDYAFKNCVSLEYLPNISSASKIGKSSFENTGIANLTIPSSVKTISASAFQKCSGLAKVTFSSTVTAIDNNAFASCSKLTNAYFKGNTPTTFGSGVFSGNSEFFIKYNGTNSTWKAQVSDYKWKGYWAYSTQLIGKIPNGGLTRPLIIIVKNAKNAAMSGATVQVGSASYKTGSDGYAYFNMPSSSSVSIKVTPKNTNHYAVYNKNTSINKKSPVLVIQIVAKHSVSGVSFNDKNITGNKYATINNDYAAKSKVTVKAETPLKIEKLQLISGNSVISTLTNLKAGEHTFKVNNTKFVIKKDVSVKMTTEDGKTITKKLNIYPFESFRDMSFTGDEDTSVDLSTTNTMFKGLKFKLNMGECLVGASFSIENDEDSATVKLNIPETELDSFSKENIVKHLKKNAKVTTDKKIEMKSAVGGSIEFAYNKNTEMMYVRKSAVFVYFELGIEYGHSFRIPTPIVVVPLRVEVEVTGKLQHEANISLSVDTNGKGTMLLMGAEHEFSLGVELSAGFGGKNVSAGVYGAGELSFKMPNLRIIANAEFGAYIKLFYYKGKHKLVYMDDTQLYPAKTRLMTPSYTTMSLYDENELTPIERTYLENRSEWLSVPTRVRSFTASSVSVLQTSAYEYIEPRIITCGDTVMMIYADDIASRATENMQALVYSIYDPILSVWSEPAQIDTNETFDNDFEVYSDGKDIFVIYSEEKDTVGLSEDLSDVASNSEITIARYDFDSGKFKTQRITDDDIYDFGGNISVIDGVPTAVWVANEENNVFGFNKANTVKMSKFIDGNWTTPEIMATGLSVVTSLDVGTIDAEKYIALTVDADNDFDTENDNYLMLISDDKNITEIKTANSGNSDAKFVSFEGKSILVWTDAGFVNTLDNNEAKILNGLEDISVGSEFAYTNCGDNKYLISFKSEQEVYAVYYNGNNWSSCAKVTDIENDLGAFDVAYYEGKFIVPYIENSVTYSDEDFTSTADLKVAYTQLCGDLTITDLIFDATDLPFGEERTITLEIANNGFVDAKKALVEIKSPSGEIVHYQTIDVNIPSGVSDYYDITFTVPSSVEIGNYVVSAVQDGIIAKDNIDEYEFELWQRNLDVQAEQLTLDGENKLIVNITNEGYVASANGTLSVGSGVYNQNIAILGSLEISSIEPGNTDTYIIDLSDDIFTDDDNDGIVTVWVDADGADSDSTNNYCTMAIVFPVDDEGFEEDDLAIQPEINPISAEIDIFDIKPISFVVTENRNTFSSIEGLVSGVDYTFEDSKVTLSEGYLRTLPEGVKDLTLIFNEGESNETTAVFTIYVLDSTPEQISGSISIVGDAVYGNTLSVNVEDVLPAHSEFTYQWIREGEIISTNAKYILTEDDVGRNIEVLISGTNDFVGELSSETITVDKAQGITLISPVVDSFGTDYISLVKYDGYEYKCDDGSWTTNATFDNLVPNKEYKFIARKAETAMNYAGVESTAVVCKTRALDFNGTVSIKGKAQRGQTLTATFTGESDATYTYQWYRNGEPIKDAVQYSYTLVAKDVDSEVYVVLTGVGSYVGTVKSQTLSVSCEHKYDWKVTNQATCNAPGEKVGTCACGNISKIVIPVKEHEISTQVLKQPTCVESGLEISSCMNCDYTETKNVPAKGHNYKEGVCADCGDKKIENCSCNCHKTGFMSFIWKILRFFYKLFGMNKVCDCGVAHY